MHQIEVKRWLIERVFSPASGWTVTVDLDAMEMGKGLQNTDHKRLVAAVHRKWMEDNGVLIQPHKKHGRVDIVANHPQYGEHLVECEGDSSKQQEQAMYSALGQILLKMDDGAKHHALAVPNTASWRTQVQKIPTYVKNELRLTVYLVSEHEVAQL